MREQVIGAVLKEKLIVIVRGVEKDRLIPLAEAMYNGGIRILELTYDSSGKVTDKETAENIRILKEHFAERMHIGAGTVTSVGQAEHTKEAGGGFIISPDTNPDIIRKTLELGMVSIPGALTPSEIQTAHINGADFVKVFPCESMGPAYIKAVKAPLSNIKLLAVGGINFTNMKEYIKAGVSGFGVGSNIVDKKLLEKEDYGAIAKLAEKYVSAVREVSEWQII